MNTIKERIEALKNQILLGNYYRVINNSSINCVIFGKLCAYDLLVDDCKRYEFLAEDWLQTLEFELERLNDEDNKKASNNIEARTA